MCTWVADDFEDNIGTVVCLLGEEVFVALGVGLVEWNGPVCFGELCESFKAMMSHLVLPSSMYLPAHPIGLRQGRLQILSRTAPSPP